MTFLQKVLRRANRPVPEAEQEHSSKNGAAPVASRRALFRTLGAGVTGAVAANLLSGGEAGATDGSAILQSETNTGTGTTTVTSSADVALAGTTTSSVPVPAAGVYGSCVAPSGYAAAYAGVMGDSSTGYGVLGFSNAASSPVAGVGGEGAAVGVHGYSSDGYGVHGLSTTGHAVVCEGGVAQLLMEPMSAIGPPNSEIHTTGELYLDSEAVLWICTNAGDPGTWTRVAAGPSGYVQGASCLLPTPIRIFDSRVADPPAAPSRASGPIGTGVTQGLQITGVEVGGHGVPDGAVAVIGNVTGVNAVGTGYLTLFPAGVSRPTASSLNYLASSPICNGVTVALSSAGAIDVYAATSVDVIFDVTGFVA
jgi:hypothetical protein